MTFLVNFVEIVHVWMTIILLMTGVFLTCFLKFPQLRNISRFFKIIRSKQLNESTKNTITPLQALLTAMSTSLGSGNIVSPPLAIAVGGPGALFWIFAYAFFGAVTKYAEVTFAIKYRTRASDKSIIGGPTSYLWNVHPFLAYWYGAFAMILFAGWSGLQSKTLAETYGRLGISEYVTGIITASFVFYMLMGGAKRIGQFSEKLVPFMCMTYLAVSLLILLQNIPLLGEMFLLVFHTAFTPTAAAGGFLGSTVLMSMRQGVFKGAYVTEAGIGTAAFPHSLADTNKATDQGVLGMYSVAIDTFFCLISGFLVLVTEVWSSGTVNNTIIFDAFNIGLPAIGPAVLIFSLTLFVIGTAIGNSFNGSKGFGFFTNNKYLTVYYAFVAIVILLGAIASTSTLWTIMEFILPLAALPNLIGIIYLAIKHRKELSE
ncbi:MAG: sodium:alanine symporter family protein [Lutibacter sp.]|nr:sodium:alanine symporter family protein [Lutibacter sp.]